MGVDGLLWAFSADSRLGVQNSGLLDTLKAWAQERFRKNLFFARLMPTKGRLRPSSLSWGRTPREGQVKRGNTIDAPN